MNNIEDFFRNALNRGLCERGARIWEHCNSKKALIDFALGSWGAEYLCKAIVEGWGISPTSIEEDFAPFINGRYTRNKDGYSSQIYCLPDADIIYISATLTIIIGYKGEIFVPANCICEVYLCNSDVLFNGDGEVIVNLFNSTAKKTSESNVKITQKNGI